MISWMIASGLVVRVSFKLWFESHCGICHLQATLSKLLTDYLLKSTQPPTLSDMGNELLYTYHIEGLKDWCGCWSGGMSECCTAGPMLLMRCDVAYWWQLRSGSILMDFSVSNPANVSEDKAVDILSVSTDFQFFFGLSHLPLTVQ